jgi:peptidoglycan/LPS O-acetylase OafA/YrhL
VASTAIQNPASAQVVKFRGYIPELDAIRAFGITIVILVHMWPYPRVYSKPLDMSWMLMDSFFVLSGFLITGILLDSRSRPDYYLNFYSRRALRILPIYYVLITALTGASLLLGSGYLYAGNPALYKWGSPWWFFVYLGNIPMAFSGKPTAVRESFAPLCSLQIEEQFYLLFPILLHRLNLQTIRRILWGLVCFSPLLRILLYYLYPDNTKIQYVFLPCRMDGLALGALIAIRFRTGHWNLPKVKLTIVTVTMIIVALLSAWRGGYEFSSPFNRTVGYLISSLTCACVVVWLVRFRGSSITACCRRPAVKHLANISYGAYLFHIPILAALVPISTAIGMRWLSQGYWRVVSVFVLTLVLASLSWRFFESPLLRLKERLFPGPVPPSDLHASGCKPAQSSTGLAAFRGV